MGRGGDMLAGHEPGAADRDRGAGGTRWTGGAGVVVGARPGGVGGRDHATVGRSEGRHS